MRAHLELRERSILDVLDLSVRFLRAHAGKYARLSAAVVLPGFVVSLAAGAGVDWLLGWMVALGVGALAQAPFTLLASRLVFEDEVPVRTVLRDALRALPTIVVVRVIQLVFALLGACLFGVGQFWVGAVVLYATEAALLERMMKGRAVSFVTKLLPPVRLVERASTDTVAVG